MTWQIFMADYRSNARFAISPRYCIPCQEILPAASYAFFSFADILAARGDAEDASAVVEQSAVLYDGTRMINDCAVLFRLFDSGDLVPFVD